MSDSLLARERTRGFHERMPKALRELGAKVHERVVWSERGDGRFIDAIRAALKKKHDAFCEFLRAKDEWGARLRAIYGKKMIELHPEGSSQKGGKGDPAGGGKLELRPLPGRASCADQVLKAAMQEVGPGPTWEDPMLTPGGEPTLDDKLAFLGDVHNVIYPDSSIGPAEWNEPECESKAESGDDAKRKSLGNLIHLYAGDVLLGIRETQFERLLGFLVDVDAEFFPERLGIPTAKGITGAGAAVPDLVQWAGGTKATLVVVFTDIVSSSALRNKLGNCAMNKLQQAHFDHAAGQVSRFGGRVVKTIGDSVMAAFRAATDALDFAMAVNAEPGDSRIAVRAGLHVGPVTVAPADVNGGTVDYASRVVHEAVGAEVWLSNEAKSHVDQDRSPQHASLQWVSHRGVKLKGFPGKQTLYSLAGLPNAQKADLVGEEHPEPEKKCLKWRDLGKAGATAGALFGLFEAIVYAIPWTWLRDHPASCGIQVTAGVFILVAALGWFVPPWCKFAWWSTLLIGLGLLILSRL